MSTREPPQTFVEAPDAVETSGITHIGPILITPTAKAYVYEYGRTLSDLYLVDGVK